MTVRVRKAILPLAIASLLAVPAIAMAQNVTSSSIAGQVINADGKPVAGAAVKVVNVPSGTIRITTTNATGRYNVSGLRVGGPYDITVAKPKGAPSRGGRNQVFLQLGETSDVNLVMQPAGVNAQKLATITVTANAASQIFSSENKGLSTQISSRQMQTMPQGNRSIGDIARQAPRINVNTASGAISVMGINNRYNHISVDGVGVGDPFGLNANGLPYESTPISPDTIAGYQISTVNFGVTSDTLGADINAVTKSGTNKFHGSVYYAYRDADKMVGKAGWLDPSDPNYSYHGYGTDRTGGFTLGGPIIKDKLFFFVSAEEEKTNEIGAGGSNGLDASLGDGPSTSNKLSPGDLNKIVDIAKQLGLHPGTYGKSTGVTLNDKRYLVKLDWNISNNHRASFSANLTRESLPVIAGNSSNSVGLSSYNYTHVTSNNNFSLELFDNWTDNFSTQLKIGYQDFKVIADVPRDQPQVVVFANGTNSPQVNLGENRFESYNSVHTKTASLFFDATYFTGNHAIKAGIFAERESIYDAFGNTEFGSYTFDSIKDFAQGKYQEYQLFHPAPGFTIKDIPGVWTYTQYSPFIQDTWQATDRLSIQYGLRMNIPLSNKKPIYNPGFEKAFGYPNNNALGWKNKIVEPRFSFNYSFDTQAKMQLHGGIGLFQTAPPAVWMTNPYQNNGMTVATYRSFDPASAPFSPNPYKQNIPAGNGTIVGKVDTIGPDFKLPAAWKAALELDRQLPWWGLIASAEAVRIKAHDAILYKAINIGAPTGTLPDGRYQYWLIPGAPSYAPGQRPSANSNPNFEALSTLLINTNEGKSDAFTLSLRKPFDGAWAGSASITWSHATAVNPGNSSQASSGYKYVVRTNPNEFVARTAARNIGESVKLSLAWQHHFFGDYLTRIGAFYVGHTGLPYAWIFSGKVNGADDTSSEDPVYIAKIGDPKVFFANSDGTAASPDLVRQFQHFVSSHHYLSTHRGLIATRNEVNSPWVSQLDLSFSQQIPGFFSGNKGEIRLDVYNFLNLLNKDWGQVQQVAFGTRTLAGYGGVNAKGQYIYELPTDADGNYQPQLLSVETAGANPSHVVSRWSAMLTVRYTF